MLVQRHNISESFSFLAWQRLQDLGLGEAGIEAKRIELVHHRVSELVDPEKFKAKLVELGIVILKVSNHTGTRHNPVNRNTVVLVGPPEAFDELITWWQAETGLSFHLYPDLERRHANSPLVKDRWERAVADGSPVALGAFSERDAKL